MRESEDKIMEGDSTVASPTGATTPKTTRQRRIDLIERAARTLFDIITKRTRSKPGLEALEEIRQDQLILADLELQETIDRILKAAIEHDASLTRMSAIEIFVILAKPSDHLGLTHDAVSLLTALSVILASDDSLDARDKGRQLATTMMDDFKRFEEDTNISKALNLESVATDDKVIFLTFDAHESSREEIAGAWRLLETLRQNNIRSTLFLTSLFVEQAPELVKQAIADGHEIGSHLKTHTSPSVLKKKKLFNKRWFLNELLATEKAVEKLTGKKPAKLFRMPFGIGDYRTLGKSAAQNILQWASEAGYVHCNWTLDTLDWVKKKNRPAGFPYLTAEKISAKVWRFVDNEDNAPIVLAHLVRYRGTDEDGPKEMVEALATEAKKNGYGFARLGEYVR